MGVIKQAVVSSGVGLVSAVSLTALFLAITDPLSDDEGAHIYADPEPADSIQELIDQLERERLYNGRRDVDPSEERFRPIVKIHFDNGHCSGAIVEFDEYETNVPGTLIATAGHCPIHEDPSSIFITATYTDASGAELSLTSLNTPEVWINPSYLASNPLGQEVKPGADDNALLFFPNMSTPDEITPITQYVMSSHMPEYNEYKIGAAEVVVAGFSHDVGENMSVDEDCDTDRYHQGGYATSDCTITEGASGTALLSTNLAGEDMSLAVLSAGLGTKLTGVDIHAENFKSYFAPFFHTQLESVPFLSHKEICMRVSEPIGAKLRTGPTTEVRTNGLAMGFNDVVRVRSAMEEEIADLDAVNVWYEILSTEDGRSGYSRSDLFEPAPCI